MAGGSHPDWGSNRGRGLTPGTGGRTRGRGYPAVRIVDQDIPLARDPSPRADVSNHSNFVVSGVGNKTLTLVPARGHEDLCERPGRVRTPSTLPTDPKSPRPTLS